MDQEGESADGWREGPSRGEGGVEEREGLSPEYRGVVMKTI